MPDRNSNSTKGIGKAVNLRLWDLLIPERERGQVPQTPFPAPESLRQRFYLLFLGAPSGEMSTM